MSYRAPPRPAKGTIDIRRRQFVDQSAALFQGNAYADFVSRQEIHIAGREVLRYFVHAGDCSLLAVAKHYANTGITVDKAVNVLQPWAQSYVNAHTSTALPYGSTEGHGTLNGSVPNTVVGGQGVPGASLSGQQNPIQPFSTSSSTQALDPSIIGDPMVMDVGPIMSPVAPVEQSASSSSSSQTPAPPPPISVSSSPLSSVSPVSQQEEPASTLSAEGNHIALTSSYQDVPMS